MKISFEDTKWYIAVTSTLIALSASIYSIQLLLFHRSGETYFYMLQDLAFIPVQVLIVTIVIDRLLKLNEKKIMTKKIFVGVGLFFSETGNNLLKLLLEITDNKEIFFSHFKITSDWNKKNYKETWNVVSKLTIKIRHDAAVIHEMKNFLISNKMFMLEMLENSNLAEHDSFTDLLLAISHLADELYMRNDLNSLPESDVAHLLIDINRVYKNLLNEWILYLMHIKKEYPFLYSLAIRSNPFNPEGTVIVY